MDPDEALRSTTGKENFLRVARLLISGGTSLLREIFDVKCPPSQLPTTLNKAATKKLLKKANLTKPQWACLYPSEGVCGISTDFDISLLFKLLKTICNLKPPAAGWDALPASADHTLTADLARVKDYRNSVYAHVTQTMEIADDQFLSLWQDISGALVRIAGQISPEKEKEWQKAIDDFEKDPLTAEGERNVQELERWCENDMEVKESIKDINDQLREMHQLMIDRFPPSSANSLTGVALNVTSSGQVGTENGGQHDQTYTPCASIIPAGENGVASDKKTVPSPTRSLGDILKREELKIKDTKDGTPSIYKLPVNEELTLSRSMISRQSIGTPRQSQEKVLLVLGATGAGKSTLINGMVNHIMGVQWEDDFRFKVTTDECQTNYITAYTIHPIDGSHVPYTFTVIDTPGFGATEGLKRDKEITEQIKKFFAIRPPEGIDHLDGIGFVTQASNARLTKTQEYIFHSILSIFGKDVSQNIFMMLTFADGQTPPVLDAIKKAKIPSQEDKHFKFNNSALFAKNNAQVGISYDEKFWQMDMSSFTRFFVEFSKSECVSLHLSKKVLKEREQLYVSLEGLKEQIKFGLDKIEEMRQEELVLQQHEKEIEANKQFTFEVNVTKPMYVKLEGTGQHTTTCVPCQITCHKNCKIPDDGEKFNCSAMGEEGKCRICPRGCIWSEHKNRPYLIEYTVSPEKGTFESLKKKYQRAVHEKATTKQMMSSLAESLENVHVQVLTMIKQAQKSVRRLDQIALKPNPLTEVEYIEVLIESEKRSVSPGWTQRVKYYEVAKRHARLLSEVKDEEESQKLVRRLSRQVSDISEKTRKALENMSIDDENADNWYSRLKFW